MATDKQRGWANSQPGRQPSHWHRPKLTPAQREEITRRLGDGERVAALAQEFGVSRRAIDHYR